MDREFLAFCWTIHRRICQVNRIDLRASSSVLRAGTIVSYGVVASGEVRNRIRLELVQRAHLETVREEVSRLSAISTPDPRLFRYQRAVVITPALLARFRSGSAVLRLTGFGGQKLLRTPAPRMPKLPVSIMRPMASPNGA